MAAPAEQTSTAPQSPPTTASGTGSMGSASTSSSAAGGRSSLGLGSAATSPIATGKTKALPPPPPPPPPVSTGTEAAEECDKRRRASRRQSADTMRAMRSLDRQYGRRRRLNTDQPSTVAVLAAPATAQTTGISVSATGNSNSSGAARLRLPMRRGDSRALFAPALLSDVPDTAAASQPAPTLHSPAGAVVPGPLSGSARLARQLILIAGRLAQAPGEQAAVRPRASLPTMGAGRSASQRSGSQAARRTRDELSDALTMKSVEIRGGRIVLDDPSSSSGGSEDEGEGEDGGPPGDQRYHSRPSIGASSVGDAAAEAEYWEDALRRRWYTRRCLGTRQPFASAHRLAQAEHRSQSPFPLLSDVRRVVHETAATLLEEEDGGAAVPVSVLLCSDAVVISSVSGASGERVPLRAVEFGEAPPAVCVLGDHSVELRDEAGRPIRLGFPQGGAQAWAALALQQQKELLVALQDLRLDEDDFVERPPPSVLLLARGRSSIAGTQASSASAAISGAVGSNHGALLGGASSSSTAHWVPDSETAVCMVCRKTAFSMMVRRHHCRACGLVICYRCSAVDRNRHRVCVRCNGASPVGPRRAGSLGAAFTGHLHSMAAVPKPSPSLHTLGRRAADYLPPGDVVMQLATTEGDGNTSAGAAAASAAASAANAAGPLTGGNRLARRPVSALFPQANATVASTATPATSVTAVATPDRPPVSG
ncbi:hypothetical protein GGI07_004066 [Coemansia sp. Benny D115]|nr:hypothetical protein GGI07_004066 [Coemansia sp. Benny D115]